METFQIRTDLALEARESVNEEESKLRGVSVDEHYEEETDIRITKVTIDTKNAEKTLGKGYDWTPDHGGTGHGGTG